MKLNDFNLNDLKKKATELAQAGASKSRQLAAIAKLKAANLGEEDTIRKSYIELGKQYFAMYGEHPEDEFAAACNIIRESQATIAANNAMIEEMKTVPTDDLADIVLDEEDSVEEEPAEEAEETPAEEEAPVEEPSAEEEPPVEETPAEEEEPVKETSADEAAE